MDDRTKLDPAYFSMPDVGWSEIAADVKRDLTRVHLSIGLALASLAQIQPGEDGGANPGDAVPTVAPDPVKLAFQMHEVAGQILTAAAAEEQSLRQIITTLRTGLAVCWDLYSIRESERVTVAEHMNNLKARIEDFERELVELRRARGTTTPTDNSD
jgi:hypothetical protein